MARTDSTQAMMVPIVLSEGPDEPVDELPVPMLGVAVLVVSSSELGCH